MILIIGLVDDFKGKEWCDVARIHQLRKMNGQRYKRLRI